MELACTCPLLEPLNVPGEQDVVDGDVPAPASTVYDAAGVDSQVLPVTVITPPCRLQGP